MYLAEMCSKVGKDNEVDQRKNLWVTLAYKANIKSHKKYFYKEKVFYM